jgi:hypothetical protein
MNETLKKLVILYSTQNLKEFYNHIGGLSQPTLISVLLDLLTIYFNDKNSSKLRELTTLWLSGFEPSLEKLGYNGYRMDAQTGNVQHCEVKPKNTDNPENKLNGGGSFNDYTEERLSADLRNNPTVLISGFVKGKLIYIIEIKFECLKDKLEELLKKRFPNGRKPGEYLRSGVFSLKDYINCPHFKIVYLRRDWQDFKEYLSKNLVSLFEGKTP